MSEDTKLKLGARPMLGPKTVEVGKVKQSFSHGRTKSVVVETKRRRIPGRPGEAAPEEAAAEAAPAEARTVAPIAPALRPAPIATPRADQPRGGDLPRDLMSRQEMQARLLRQAEEDRMRQGEEARRRDDRARIDAETARVDAAAAPVEAVVEAAPVVEIAPIAMPEPIAPVAAAPVTAPARPAMAPRVPIAPRPVVAAPAAPAEQARGPVFRRPAAAPAAPRRPEPAQPRNRAGDDRRQSGKLTVTKALDGDDSVRVRSLAALRRAREKDKRAFAQGGAQVKQVRDVVVPETITVQELANRMAERAADLVKALFKMGMPVTVTEDIDQDTAELLVTEFGHNLKRVSESDVETGLVGEVDAEADTQPRPPVVTIMGHVDHGKTSLLDALRGTDKVKGEAGGITQHIGAYQVTLKGGEQITFLDTPGHEAFTEMRMRGANVTDIVVLVVAADDGLMPQTIEAINHTKAAGVPMIVAINKMDKPGADPARIRTALLQYEVVVEEMSGDVQDVEVSALKKTGLEELTEKILLQAEILELRANPDRAAEATVVEARLDKGRGPLATVLVNRGTLRVGDIFVVGAESGKVRALIDDKGRQVKSAGPAMPVEVLGLSGVPDAGDPFSVVENEARAREVALYRQGLITRKRTATAPATLETMFASRESKTQEYALVVKGDVQGSVQAIVSSLNKLSTDNIRVRVLHSGVGAITESDVTLAAASKAPIIGFGVRANAKAREFANRDGVALKYYDIIYDLIDEMKAAMIGQLGTEAIEHVVGRANIQAVFAAGKGKAAGLLVTEGIIRKALKARVMRDDVIMYTGEISSLRRFKDEVGEVGSGVECGVTFANYGEMLAGDVLETFEVEQRVRSL